MKVESWWEWCIHVIRSGRSVCYMGRPGSTRELSNASLGELKKAAARVSHGMDPAEVFCFSQGILVWLWKSDGRGAVCLTLLLCSQPFAAVRDCLHGSILIMEIPLGRALKGRCWMDSVSVCVCMWIPLQVPGTGMLWKHDGLHRTGAGFCECGGFASKSYIQICRFTVVLKLLTKLRPFDMSQVKLLNAENVCDDANGGNPSKRLQAKLQLLMFQGAYWIVTLRGHLSHGKCSFGKSRGSPMECVCFGSLD